MRINLFKLFLFFCVCIPACGMDKKQSTITRNLLNTYIPYEIKTNAIVKTEAKPVNLESISQWDIDHNLIKKYAKNGAYEKSIQLYEKIAHKIPYDTSILKNAHQEKCNNILAIIEDCALNGNSKAQGIITERLLKACEPLFYINQEEATKYALSYFIFLLNLVEKKIPILTPNPVKEKIVQLIDHGCPELKVILRSCRCLQATETQKQITDHLFMEQTCPNNPLIELTCKYLLEKIDTQTFVSKITIQKGIPHITDTLKKIACMPICPKIINILQRALPENNSSFASDIYYFLAFLSYENKDCAQADSFYTKIIESKNIYSKHQIVLTNAIKARLANIESINQEDIIYFSNNFGTLYTQLEKIKKTDPKLSYKIGLLIDALLKQNKIKENSKHIIMGLEHLEYAVQNGNWPSAILKKINGLSSSFHMQLSVFDENNKKVSQTLEEIYLAIQKRYQETHNSQDIEIATIIAECKQHDSNTYNKHAPLLLKCLRLIYDETEQKYNDPTYAHSTLKQFACSQTATKLLPHLTNTLKKNGTNSRALQLQYLLGLLYEGKGNYGIAHHYISMVNLPMSYEMLLNKARIYQATQKNICPKELESIITHFIKNKKSSIHDQTIISSVINQIITMITKTKNYTLAQNLITKSMHVDTMLKDAIELAINIRKHIGENNNSYLIQWDEWLSTCQLCEKIEKHHPDHYDPDTNLKISVLLMIKTPRSPQKKIIAHIIAGLASTTISEQEKNGFSQICGVLYHGWAQYNKDQEELYLSLLNKAIEYDCAQARYDKAMYLIHGKAVIDKNTISEAINLLEESIHKDTDQNGLCILELGYITCNYFFKKTLCKKIASYIDFDMEKAIIFFTQAAVKNYNHDALQWLATIYGGHCDELNQTITEKHIDFKKALTALNLLIDSNHNTLENILRRRDIHCRLEKYDKAIEDLNIIIETEHLCKDDKAFIPIALSNKGYLLLKNNPSETDFDQSVDCLIQAHLLLNTMISSDSYLQTSEEHVNELNLIIKRAEQYILENNMNENAVKCCCLIATLSTIHQDSITTNRNDIADYLLRAAKMGNFDAQYTSTLFLQQSYFFNATYIIEGLKCAYQALLNPIAHHRELEVQSLLKTLHWMTQEGVTLAYYILCDYYKKNKSELEKIILLFNKAEHKKDAFEETKMVEKIYKSCRNTFSVYKNSYMKNPKKASLIDIYATITLASMQLHHKNKKNLLESLSSLAVVMDNITGEKMALCKRYVCVLLSVNYWNLVEITPEGKEQYLYLKGGIKCNCISSAQQMARLWLAQQKGKEIDMPITREDFFPLLIHNIKIDPGNTQSLDLIHDCTLLLEQKNNTIQESATRSSDNTETIALMLKKNLVKHKWYVSKSEPFGKAMSIFLDKDSTFFPEMPSLLEKAIKKERHPIALIVRALLSLTGEEIQQNYPESEDFLDLALEYGLVIDTSNKHKKQFHDSGTANIFLTYIKELLTKKHPVTIKMCLLSKIKNQLIASGINMADFCEVSKVSGYDLSDDPQWNMI